MKRAINIAIISALLFGCKPAGNLDAAKYVRHLEDPDNNYRKSVMAGRVQYTFQLATPEYMACKQGQENTDTLSNETIARIGELKGYLFFIINIAAQDQSTTVSEQMNNKLGAQSSIMYYQQSAANDITLNHKGNTIKPATYLYENNYSLVAHNTIVVGFEVTDKSDDYQLVFNDRYNNNPFLKATYSKAEIASLPHLQIN